MQRTLQNGAAQLFACVRVWLREDEAAVLADDWSVGRRGVGGAGSRLVGRALVGHVAGQEAFPLPQTVRVFAEGTELRVHSSRAVFFLKY